MRVGKQRVDREEWCAREGLGEGRSAGESRGPGEGRVGKNKWSRGTGEGRGAGDDLGRGGRMG